VAEPASDVLRDSCTRKYRIGKGIARIGKSASCRRHGGSTWRLVGEFFDGCMGGLGSGKPCTP